MNIRRLAAGALLVGVLATIPQGVFGQELHQELQGIWRAEVVSVIDSRTIIVPGSDAVESIVQTIEVEILEGERAGERVVFENDFIQLAEGDRFFLNYLSTVGGVEFYSVREIDRRMPMLALVMFFVLVILLFGGVQGLRSLVSLAGSLFIIAYVLLPTLIGGAPPLLVSIAVATAILFFAVFFTHGFNRRSFVAFLGTVCAVALTGIIATVSVRVTGLTGFVSEETVYLNLSTGGQLDFVGLFLGAIIIGALGVLDDIAITQVAVVRELYGANKTARPLAVYRSAMRVGREHVSALVNTLVLAYTGAALPLLLLFSQSDSPAGAIFNREIFAAEIVRTIVGSVGLVLAVPITTGLAVWVLRNMRGVQDTSAHTHTHST